MATDRSEYVKRWKIENRDKYVAGYKAYTEKTKAKKSEYDRKRRECRETWHITKIISTSKCSLALSSAINFSADYIILLQI